MIKKVIIVGGGKVGRHLAQLLIEQQCQVRLVELDSTRLAALENELPRQILVAGNGTEAAVLEEAGIHQAQIVAAVTDLDETNLVICNIARLGYDVPRVIARVNDPKNSWLYTPAMGVDVAFNQASLMAHLVAEEMSLGDMITLLKLRKGHYSLIEEKVQVAAPAVGHRLSELRLPDKCALTAVIRAGQLLLPRAELILQPADQVLALIDSSQLGELAALLGNAPALEANPE